MLTLKWLFSPLATDASLSDIIIWWEKRRVPYNVIVGIVGFISLIIFLIAISLSGRLEPGEDAVEPMALFMAPILINICYTAGWIVQGFVKVILPSYSTGLERKLFVLGFGFSLLMAILPAVIWIGTDVFLLLKPM